MSSDKTQVTQQAIESFVSGPNNNNCSSNNTSDKQIEKPVIYIAPSKFDQACKVFKDQLLLQPANKMQSKANNRKQNTAATATAVTKSNHIVNRTAMAHNKSNGGSALLNPSNTQPLLKKSGQASFLKNMDSSSGGLPIG